MSTGLLTPTLALTLTLTQAASPELAESAQSLLRVPLARLADTSSFVRCRALQTLAQLAESKALPTGGFQEAAALGLERLGDKNANVRRAALQLFSTLLEFNPFGPRSAGTTSQPPRGLAAAAAGVRRAARRRRAGRKADADADADAAASGAVAEREPGRDAAASARGAGLKAVDAALLLEGRLRAKLGEVDSLLGSTPPPTRALPPTRSATAHCSGSTVTPPHPHPHPHPHLTSPAPAPAPSQGARPSAILTLVFSKEPSIKAAALNAAQAVYLQIGGSRRGISLEQLVGTAAALIGLVREASLAELTSLEEVVGEWQKQKLIPEGLLSLLWQLVQGQRSLPAPPADADATPTPRTGFTERSALALQHGRVGDAPLLTAKLDVLIVQLQAQVAQLAPAKRNAGREAAPGVDVSLVRQLCIALERSAPSGGGRAAPPSPKVVKAVGKALEQFFVTPPPHAQAEAWYAAAQDALGALFAYSDAPESWCTSTLHAMGGRPRASRRPPVDAASLSRPFSRLATWRSRCRCTSRSATSCAHEQDSMWTLQARRRRRAQGAAQGQAGAAEVPPRDH